MVCAKKAATEIADAIGETATVTTPTWRNHLYACTYQYPDAGMTLSVKELSSWAQTFGYFNGLARSLHKTIPIFELGQGAFRTRDGSIVVRKDWKVLVVGAGGLPSQFGSPETSSHEVALTVAGVIMGCWNGD